MATQNPTDNFGWELPQVGGDSGSWGTKLNVIIGDDVTGIDAVVKAISDKADEAEAVHAAQAAVRLAANFTLTSGQAVAVEWDTEIIDTDDMFALGEPTR